MIRRGIDCYQPYASNSDGINWEIAAIYFAPLGLLGINWTSNPGRRSVRLRRMVAWPGLT